MEKLRAAVKEWLTNERHMDETEDGMLEWEFYADYRDTLSDSTVKECMEDLDEGETPMMKLVNKIIGWYSDEEWTVRNDLVNELIDFFNDDEENYPHGLSSGEEETIGEIVDELICFKYPIDHYLKQSVCVNIMVDTGDGNYDYVCNHVYPAYDGRLENPIDDEASIVWLASTQGYSKERLAEALAEGDMSNPNGFLESVRVEVANEASHMNVLTFLVEMDVERLMKLNELVELQSVDGVHYDSRENPDCGVILIGKDAETGLYDPWNGGGSCFEIELEKDVELPIKFIRSALPDGGDGHSIKSVYGMCRSAWRDAVKSIEEPAKKSA